LAPVDSREPARLDTIVEFAEFARLSRSQVERLVEEGMPCVDVSIKTPGRRAKRCLRFDRAACVGWLSARP
jgi:hypothetical protein